jgi:methyltransferase
MMGWAQVILALCALQRLVELAVARRNEQRLRALGAVEHGAAHYKLVVALHLAWFAALALVLRPDTAVSWPLIVVFALLQLGRIWVLATLGRFWTTRIISVPGAPLVARGPYRFLRHPNYAIVAAEIAVLPLAFGQWTIAAAFTALNAAMLWLRIRTEDAALAERRMAAAPAEPGLQPRI